MCYQVRVAGTAFWRAQQVMLKLYAGTKAERLEEACIMDAAPGADSDNGVRLFCKVFSDGSTHVVNAADCEPLPAREFKPGERVRRAMWSGAEEDAEVRRAAPDYARGEMMSRLVAEAHALSLTN